MTFQLRPAERSDWDFIWHLRQRTMKSLIERTYGWREDEQEGYARESLNGSIVMVDEAAVGVITLSDWGDELHLVWMALAPEHQRRGLGGELIRYAQEEASRLRKPLTLQVLRVNPAAALYERFGFKVYDRNGPDKLLMRWEGRA